MSLVDHARNYSGRVAKNIFPAAAARPGDTRKRSEQIVSQASWRPIEIRAPRICRGRASVGHSKILQSSCRLLRKRRDSVRRTCRYSLPANRKHARDEEARRLAGVCAVIIQGEVSSVYILQFKVKNSKRYSRLLYITHGKIFFIKNDDAKLSC